VYAGSSGGLVHGFLRALLQDQRELGEELPAAFGSRASYHPQLRLLLTAALPGTPRVPGVLKSWLADGAGDGAATEELRRLVRDSGHALAALHGSDLATAPVYGPSREIAGLEHQLGIVRGVWPEAAERVARSLGSPPAAADHPEDIVLSHGDFTPSQVLLGGRVPAVVDLDTLCWADPAMDLGRYLAHVHLLGRKAGGPGARERVEALGNEFLRGYAGVSTRTSSAALAADRIAFYMATTLARSALHACRQLKPKRFELAVSLLEEVRTRRIQL
jgi:aminoglycoside phosphotransferase (APT) family kinase protein